MGIAVLSALIIILLLGYRFYVSPQIQHYINPSWQKSTPSRRFMDGVSFFPVRPEVLTGFQFKSIALDVIISPILAVQFGWLPAILWLLFGALFFGWVQDYLATIISIRSRGGTFIELFDQYFNRLSRTLIYIVILAYLLIIISQFGLLLSSLVSRVDILVPLLFSILAGLLAGYLILLNRINLVITTFISFSVVLVGIWLSTFTPIQEGIHSVNQYIFNLDRLIPIEGILGSFNWHGIISLFVIFTIGFLIANTPLRRFAVPFNYVSAWIVIFCFAVALIGFSFASITGSIDTNFELPVINTDAQSTIGPIWPILFVSLSSGAVSGWHSLVSSFSTARLVEKEPHVQTITTRAIFIETIVVALILIFAATFGVSSGFFNAKQDYLLAAGPANIFATGLSRSWNTLGVSESLGVSVSAFLLTLMFISVLHLVIRYASTIQSELIGKRFFLLRKRSVSTLIVLTISLLLILFGLRESLWILFAGVNQLLASIVLLFASIWLLNQGKKIWWTILPAIFLFLTGLVAIFYSAVYQPLLAGYSFTSNIIAQLSFANLMSILFAFLFILACGYIFFIGVRKVKQLGVKNHGPLF